MFTYVKAHNFKSLKKIDFNLKKSKNKINKLIAIYGENGSGKTNVVQLFEFLQRSILTRVSDVIFSKLPKDMLIMKSMKDEEKERDIKDFLNILLETSRYRMLNEDEPTEIEYGFNIDGIEGYYYIKFEDKIEEEKLYYQVNKQRGELFHILEHEDKMDIELNMSIFPNEKYNEELKEEIQKYWGKHTFISLVYYEMLDKNKEYINSNITENMRKFIKEIESMHVHVDKMRSLPESNGIRSMAKGTISKKDKDSKNSTKMLDKYEEILKIFFTQAYSDIKDVRYEIKEYEDEISYKLVFEKMIGNKKRIIPFDDESEGTKRIVRQFDSLTGALIGKTVIIDEIDNGIHDVLMKNIIMSIKDEITGQLVITTHNTLLLELLPKENIYIIDIDYKGNKKINCINDYDLKIQKNNNNRDLYFKGMFGGLPMSDYVDFETIKLVLKEYEKDD